MKNGRNRYCLKTTFKVKIGTRACYFFVLKLKNIIINLKYPDIFIVKKSCKKTFEISQVIKNYKLKFMLILKKYIDEKLDEVVKDGILVNCIILCLCVKHTNKAQG